MCLEAEEIECDVEPKINIKARNIASVTGEKLSRSSGNRVCGYVYQHHYYQGYYGWVGLGRFGHNFNSKYTNVISSLYVLSNCIMDLYTGRDLTGRSKSYVGAVSWVGNEWNDKFQSVYCTCKP